MHGPQGLLNHELRTYKKGKGNFWFINSTGFVTLFNLTHGRLLIGVKKYRMNIGPEVFSIVT